MRFTFFILTMVFLSACSTTITDSKASTNENTQRYLPASFTTENMMKVHPGMSSEMILNIFGSPKSIRQSVCGGRNSWICTTWEYGKPPYESASFTFSGDHPEKLKLNDFRIDRD